MNTTVLTVVRDPFIPWKKVSEYVPEAIRRGFPVLAYVDTTGTDPDKDIERLEAMGATVRPYTSKGFPESAFALSLKEVKTEWMLWVSDDEVPGEALWKFAVSPPAKRAFRVRMISLLPDGSHYGPDQYQPRLFPLAGRPRIPRDAFETGLVFDVAEYDSLELVLWHYCNLAPREEREAKIARYIEMEKVRGFPDYAEVTRRLYLYEDFPALSRPLAPFYAAQLPRAPVPA